MALGSMGCPSDPRPREAYPDAGAAGDLGVVRVGSTLGDSDGDEQRPPTTGRAAARAWLQAGAWRRWRCEATAHASMAPSPHSMNRICNNEVLANAPPGAPWPVGAASVKELRDNANPERVVGYALYLKARAETDGAGWFWFEYVLPSEALDPPAPREADGTVAEGYGDRGGALDVCVNCHRRSGSNDAGLMGYGDFVYTRVPAP
jgi:hypothetical protein